MQQPQVLRRLTKRRLVVSGFFLQKHCVAKFFLSEKSRKRARDYERECRGYEYAKNAKLPTVNFIQAGVIDNAHFVVYEYLTDSISLNDLWVSASAAQQKEIFFKAIDLVAQLHRAGYIHEDLHFDNFRYQKNGELFLLDYAAIRKPYLLSKSKLFANLAMLFAQLNNKSASLTAIGFNHYQKSFHLAQHSDQLFMRRVENAVLKRKQHALAKIFRNTSHLLCQKTAELRNFCYKEFQSQLNQLMLQPTFEGQLLETSADQQIYQLQLVGQTFYVLKFSRLSLVKALFTQSAHLPWRQAWRSVHALAYEEVSSFKPIALIENLHYGINDQGYVIVARM